MYISVLGLKWQPWVTLCEIYCYSYWCSWPITISINSLAPGRPGCNFKLQFLYSRNKVRWVYWIHPVCLSVRLSVCPLTFRVGPVASAVLDGFFPYLVQMINSMRGCVACDDPWPWPISSRSFGLDLENRVRSVASTVLDGFFLYLAQMISIIRGCVVCYVFFRI